ncbi:Uncharacterised protein [Vibrio cholerae]|nr:Uncharacterised protein [Vibrio cholerae]
MIAANFSASERYTTSGISLRTIGLLVGITTVSKP